MATITSAAPDKIVSVKQFKGLNECRDGDTKLALGEASVCQNWKVTRDGNLQRRPGIKSLATLSNSNQITGMWGGYVGGVEYLLATVGSSVYKIYDSENGGYLNPPVAISGTSGLISGSHVHMFGFDEKVYFLDGSHYCEWDGTTFKSVEGYAPIVIHVLGPDNTANAGGELLEQVNKLTAKRRAWLSPDGTGKTFTLPEAVASVDRIINTVDGSQVVTSWSVSGRQITFVTAPSAGVDTIEVQYTATASYRSQINAMRYSELFSGENDRRVFLYGDGTNELFYSDIDYNGIARADYFPDMNEIAVGDSNTPVTGLIRHYSRLICYKLDSTWDIATSFLQLADGSTIASFYVNPVNRAIGNEAPGQVQLVLNSPRTLFQNELYEWKGSTRTGNLTNDERQAVRISDRIYSSLRDFDFANAICYDDNANQEYYVVYNGTALVHNYAVNAWYKYTNIHATCMWSFHNVLHYGTNSGMIVQLTELAKDDLGTAINAVWESGSMDFGADYMRKYSSVIWVSVKPQSSSYVEVTLRTDRKNDFAVKSIAIGADGGFTEWDFRSFSFSDNTEPKMSRIRLKAKKFEFYKIIFQSNKEATTATILGFDIRTRQTGYAK